MSYLFASASILRDRIVPPKQLDAALFEQNKARLAAVSLQDVIWRKLIETCREPIKVSQTHSSHTVEVLGAICYHRSLTDGLITSSYRYKPGNTQKSFRTYTNDSFLVDLPLLCNTFVIDAFLCQWKQEIEAIFHQPEVSDEEIPRYNIDWAYPPAERLSDVLSRGLLSALRQSTWWKRLRYQVKEALALDEEVLGLARRARHQRHSSAITDYNYNQVMRNIDLFRQVNLDAPNLLWLCSMGIRTCLRPEVLPKEVIKDLKATILQSGRARNWRLIANANVRDFTAAIEWTSSPHWHYLKEYLDLHALLNRNQVIPRRISHLFDDATWSISECGNIDYRGVLVTPQLLNHIIDAALASKDTTQFLSEELNVVISWLENVQPRLDRNQQSQGWPWLKRKAFEWFTELQLKGIMEPDGWDCVLGETILGEYRFLPLRNAWSVKKEAITYRHCADKFIEECKAGTFRIFSIKSLDGKHKATAGYVFLDNSWHLDQIQGFANKGVSDNLRQIADSLAEGLSLVNEGAKERKFYDDQDLESLGGKKKFHCFTPFLNSIISDNTK